ncbi:MAG: hypothetical protein ACFFCW_26780 [Candidatus Hodarchaeota archaeon]
MTQLRTAAEIWMMKPTREDLVAGARYALITLPWTFNRMMMSTSSAGQQSRGLNIAKGIVGQQILHRALTERGLEAHVQRKSHRDEDLFDFYVSINGAMAKLDVKTFNYYSDYSVIGRDVLSPELIIDNASYPGPDWRRFFPMLVPHTQIGQDKEGYCFAMASSIDLRRDIDKNRKGHALAAFPYGKVMPFLSSKRLCLVREDFRQGIFLKCSYTREMLFADEIELNIVGEWDGEIAVVSINLKPGYTSVDVGPFSCVSSFNINRPDYDRLSGEQIEISVCGNDLKAPVYNASRTNINVDPQEPLVLSSQDFCNLMLPSDYTLYMIGWLTKKEFLEKCRNYTGWVWPLDRANKFENQPWSMITENDRKNITRAGFGDCIDDKPRLLKAGWLKTNGKGGGACCYVFPNIGRQGGVKETNLYVLPRDLHVMNELGT